MLNIRIGKSHFDNKNVLPLQLLSKLRLYDNLFTREQYLKWRRITEQYTFRFVTVPHSTFRRSVNVQIILCSFSHKQARLNIFHYWSLPRGELNLLCMKGTKDELLANKEEYQWWCLMALINDFFPWNSLFEATSNNCLFVNLMKNSTRLQVTWGKYLFQFFYHLSVPAEEPSNNWGIHFCFRYLSQVSDFNLQWFFKNRWGLFKLEETLHADDDVVCDKLGLVLAASLALVIYDGRCLWVEFRDAFWTHAMDLVVHSIWMVV